MDKLLVFAYGSNLNIEDFCKYSARNGLENPEIKKITIAELKNFSLSWTTFSKKRGCGVLNIIPKENESVWGVIYEVDENTLAILDKKEGHPQHYYRKIKTFADTAGNNIDAWVYMANPSHITENFWPDDNYKNIVIEGATQHGLPEEYINNLREKVPVRSTPAKDNNNFKTAIYSGQGVGPVTLSTWCNLFRNFDIGSLDILYSHEFTRENLEKYNLIILPGGGGLRICWGLGDLGKENIRNYLKSGGKLLGVCAGAYAITAHRQDYIGISPVKIVDFKNCCRGEATLNLRITGTGSHFFGLSENEIIPIIYHNGPVIYRDMDIPGYKSFNVLATFEEELVLESGNKGDMINTPAAWMNDYGNGKVFGISPHIERTPDYEYLMARLISNIFLNES